MQVKTLHFLRAMFCGTGASIRTAQEMLNFIHTVDASATPLPRSVKRCWRQVEMSHASMTSATKMKVCSFPVPADIMLLMSDPIENIRMEFVDPTEALVRLLVSSPLAADPANLALFPEDSPVLEDYCHGDRWHRVQSALPPGAAALTCTL